MIPSLNAPLLFEAELFEMEQTKRTRQFIDQHGCQPNPSEAADITAAARALAQALARGECLPDIPNDEPQAAAEAEAAPTSKPPSP